jgi:hypothetical protein
LRLAGRPNIAWPRNCFHSTFETDAAPLALSGFVSSPRQLATSGLMKMRDGFAPLRSTLTSVPEMKKVPLNEWSISAFFRKRSL